MTPGSFLTTPPPDRCLLRLVQYTPWQFSEHTERPCNPEIGFVTLVPKFFLWMYYSTFELNVLRHPFLTTDPRRPPLTTDSGVFSSTSNRILTPTPLCLLLYSLTWLEPLITLWLNSLVSLDISSLHTWSYRWREVCRTSSETFRCYKGNMDRNLTVCLSWVSLFLSFPLLSFSLSLPPTPCATSHQTPFPFYTYTHRSSCHLHPIYRSNRRASGRQWEQSGLTGSTLQKTRSRTDVNK